MLASVAPVVPTSVDAASASQQLSPQYPAPMARGQSASIHLPGATASSTPGAAFHQQHQAQVPVPAEGFTAYTHWKVDPAGHVTRQIFQAPTYHSVGGKWVPVDPSIKPFSDSSLPLSAEGAPRPIRFGQAASRIAEFELDGGPVTISAPALMIGAPQAIANGALYTNVATATDLQYAITANGLKEDLILRSAQSPHQFTFHIADPKGQLGSAHPQADGGVLFDARIDGDAVLGLAAPLAYVQPPSEATAPIPADRTSAHMTVTPVKGGFDVTVSVDPQWLRGKAFPIVLDPTVTYNYSDSGGSMLAGTIAYAANGCGGCQSVNPNATAVGTFTGGGYDDEPARTVYKFNLGIPPQSPVSSASLIQDTTACLGWTGHPETYYCNQHSYTVELHALDGSWDTTTNYSTFNSITDGTVTASVTQPAFLITDPGCGGCFSMTWSSAALTSMIQNWTNTPSSNNGFTLKLSSEPYNIGGPYWAYKQDDGTQFGGAHPYLQVTFAPVPWQPQNVTATGGNASATVSWTPGAAVPSAVTSFTVATYTGSGSLVKTQTACATCTNAQVTGLTNGQTYYFGVYATNANGNSPTTNSAQVTLAVPPTITKWVDSAASLLPGQTAKFHVKVTSTSTGALPVSGISDALPGGFALLGSVGNVTVVTPSGSAACGTACTLTGNTLGYGSFTLQSSSDYLQLDYTAVATADGQGCLPQVNTATAWNAQAPASSSVSVTTCEGGLGLEKYWSYETRQLGGGATASVNAADGNLVVQQTDSAPVQAHGRLGFVVRRTYNSEDTAIANLPGSFGYGWQLNVSQTDGVLGDSVGASALYVPGSLTATNPLAVTLIDRDGTRHVFQPNALSTPIDVMSASCSIFGGSCTSPAPDSGASGVLGDVSPVSLGAALTASANTTYDHICVDETFTPPPGVHLGLWRYILTQNSTIGGACGGALSAAPQVVGYGLVGTDRTRYEFYLDGRILSMEDNTGNRLQYTYQSAPAPQTLSLGNLQSITEPSSGRAISFQTSTNTVVMTDVANRTTTYRLDGTFPNAHLTEVDNPDGSVVRYAYGSSCNLNGFTSNAGANQMCSATDPRGNTTYFSYTSTSSDASPVTFPVLGRIQSVSDRREAGVSAGSRVDTTTFKYYANTATQPYTVVDQAGHRTRYKTIDSFGRVGETDAGTTSDQYSHVTLQTWDGDTDPQTGQVTFCRQPDSAIDHELCHVVVESLNDTETGVLNGISTQDENTSYVYNDAGRLLEQHQCLGAANASPTALPPCSSTLDTTYGYYSQYFEAGRTASSRAYNDTPVGYNSLKGYGTVTADAGPRWDANTLFVIVDQTAMVPPRGNVSGATVSTYETTYYTDRSPSQSPNVVPSGTVCTTPQSLGTWNTGLLCEVSGPAFDNSGRATVTTYTYDTHGQKVGMATPKANAEGGQAYQYVYYTDSNKDLSGTTVAGGWLQGIVDPYGRFVAYGYDAYGHVVRTWDRDATARAGAPLSSYPGSLSGPPSGSYVETLYGTGTGTAPYGTPWRYLLSQRDQLVNLTTYTVDGNGNVTTVRPPRGNQAGNASYDVVKTYDANDDLATMTMPAEAPAATTYGYDAFNNQVSTADPRGNVVVDQYDSVNRPTGHIFTRGVWPSDTTTVPTACRQSTSSDAPIPMGRILCKSATSYDGNDNKITSSDGNAQTTTFFYDSVRRETSRRVPHDATVTPAVMDRTDTIYDADGHVLTVCSPRLFTEGGGTCATSSSYAEQRTYRPSGRMVSDTTYRQAAGQAITVLLTYDADGNAVSTVDPNGVTTTDVYDLLDRHISETKPRDASSSGTTSWTYDPVGNVLSVLKPGPSGAGTGSDGALVIDGTTAASSSDGLLHNSTSPYTLANGKNYSSVTLQNGGWLSVPQYNSATGTGGVLQFSVTGKVAICSNCGISVLGLGPTGGQGYVTALTNGDPGKGSGPGQGGVWGTADGAGGGGGGHAGVGIAGHGFVGSNGGAGGGAYGAADLSDSGSGTLGMGSGGGGGGSNGSNLIGNGANGGGFIHISAAEIDDSGVIQADGATAAPVNGNLGTGGGAGGGGSGGSVWLTAPTVVLTNASSLTVNGGQGGTAGGGGNGGNGAPGLVRLDVDNLSGGGSGVTAYRTYLGRITAYSYDFDNRLQDTVQGASSLSASSAGVSTGSGNGRTRLGYDADGHVVGRYEPRAFQGSASNPDPLFMMRTDYDVDGRPSAQYMPRYDNVDDSGNYSDPFTTDTQTAQCKTGAAGYATNVGVCITTMTYDANGNPNVMRLPTSTSGTDNRYVQYAYTDDNLLASVNAPSPTVSGGRVTAEQYLYDGDGKQTRTTDANGVQQTTAYYSDELVRSVTGSPNGSLTHITSYGYDANGNRTTVTDGANNVSTAKYYADNLLMDAIDGAGNDTHYVYDDNGNPLQVYSPAAWATHNGNANSTNASGTPTANTFTYDNLLATSTVPVTTTSSGPTLQRETAYTYDAGGRTLGQTVLSVNGAGQSTTVGSETFSYFPDDRLASQTGHTGTTITTTYDPAGNRTAVSDSSSSSTVSATHYLDGLTRTVDDGGRAQQYAYDGEGQRITAKDLVDGSPSTAYLTQYTYGDAEVPTTMVAAAENSGTTTWAYDAGARLVTQTDPNGQSTSWSYNPDNTLSSQVLSKSGTVAAFCYPLYDGDYRQREQAFATDSSTCTNGSGLEGLYTYGYDAAGRVNSFQNGSSTTTYSHDANGNRLTSAVQGGATTSYCYNADNSIASSYSGTGACPTTATYSYSGYGTLTTDGSKSYCYDGFDRMTAAIQTSSANPACPSIAGNAGLYQYDGLDRQISHRDANTTTTTAEHYDGLSSTSVMVSPASGPDTVYALSPSGLHLGLETASGSPTFQYALGDGKGNVDLVSSSAGTVLCGVRYDPFGVPLQAGTYSGCSSSQTSDDVAYRNARVDMTTFDYQFGARTYDPAKAQFLTPDSYRAAAPSQNLSVGMDPLTQNRYSYVNGDPVNLVDPDGHNPCREEACGPVVSYENAYADANRGQWPTAPQVTSYLQRTTQVTTRYSVGVCDLESEEITIGLAPTCKFFPSSTNRPDDAQVQSWCRLGFGEQQAKWDRCVAHGIMDFQGLRFADNSFVPLQCTDQCSLPEELRQTREELKAAVIGVATLGMGVLPEASDLLAGGDRAAAEGDAAAAARGGAGPVLQGQSGVQQAIADLQASGGTVLGREITLDVNGVRARPDLFVELPNGVRAFLEIKTGPYARLTPNQAAAYPQIWQGGAVPTGANAMGVPGLAVGQPLGPTPVWVIYLR